MEDASNRGNLLVHCQMGKSRSVAIVIAYLMKYMNMKLNDAFNYVKRIRKIALPNLGFMKALGQFEKKLFP
jgi:protein-tyrosine phosphatase